MKLAEKTRRICKRLNAADNKQKKLEEAQAATRLKKISTLVGFSSEVADLLLAKIQKDKKIIYDSPEGFNNLQLEIEHYATGQPKSKEYVLETKLKVDSSAADPNRCIYPLLNERYKFDNEAETVRAVNIALAVRCVELIAWCEVSGYTINITSGCRGIRVLDELFLRIAIGW